MSTIWQKLRDIPTHWISLLTLIVALISVLVPLEMTPPVPPHVQLIYDTVENLPSGAVVVMSADNNAGFYARHYGGQVALMRQLLTKDVKILLVGLGYEDGPLILQKVLEWTDEDIQANNKVYGEDYIHLGYVAGFESAAASFCRNIPETISIDFYGTDISEYSIMDGIQDANDVDLWIQVGPPMFMPIIRQYAIAYDAGSKLIAIGFEGALSTYIVQMDAGNLLSGVQGSQDGVILESLVNHPFIATAQYRGGNLLMFLAMGLIIAGNIVHYMAGKEEDT